MNVVGQPWPRLVDVKFSVRVAAVRPPTLMLIRDDMNGRLELAQWESCLGLDTAVTNAPV